MVLWCLYVGYYSIITAIYAISAVKIYMQEIFSEFHRFIERFFLIICWFKLSWATLSVAHVSDAVCLSCLQMGRVNKFLGACINQYTIDVKVLWRCILVVSLHTVSFVGGWVGVRG